MSNTGHKGITDMREWGIPSLRVASMWDGELEQEYVPIRRNYERALRKALRVRHRIWKRQGKPNTERAVRAHGVLYRRLTGLLKWSRKGEGQTS